MIDGTLVIEARTPKTTAASPDPVIGFALLEAPETSEGRRAAQRLGRYAVDAVELGSMLDGRSKVSTSASRSTARVPAESAAPVRTAAELRRLPVAERCEAMFVTVQFGSGPAAAGRRGAR